MEGVIELAEEVFHMPVRLGVPQYVTGLIDVVRNPIHATGVGLLLFGHLSEQSSKHKKHNSEGLSAVFGKVKNWVKGNF